MELLHNIGKRIRIARMEFDWKQWDLAEKMGVSQNTVSSWESGHTEVGSLTLVRLSELFSKPIDYFFEPFDKQMTAPKKTLSQKKETGLKRKAA